MIDELKGKKALVTGSGSPTGIGFACAKALVREGAQVAVTSTSARIHERAEELGAGHARGFVADLTDRAQVHDLVAAAIADLGQIDVLVNNAGNFFAGYFEELSPAQVRNQIETLLFGPMNVTRAVLPVMRSQRSGLVLTISSTAGIAGQLFCTAYAAAKFGIEGWMESLAPEVAPFGIRTMLVEPGFFRTELLTNDSTTFAEPHIDDYAAQTRDIVTAWKGMNGKQGGDPAKLADAIVMLGSLEEPPIRFAAGADAMQTFETKASSLLAQAKAYRELSASLAYD